jgi:type VI secretion system protein ImpF
MARVDKKKKLRPSILDRLLDNEPHNQTEIDVGKHQRLKELRNSVRRDLELLLNTRFRVVEPPEEFVEIEHSLLNYGMPDLATVNIVDIDKRKTFTHKLENILRHFEPRFKTVKVQYLDNKDNADRTLRFRIDAVLYADPAPEVVVFLPVVSESTPTRLRIPMSPG